MKAMNNVDTFFSTYLFVTTNSVTLHFKPMQVHQQCLSSHGSIYQVHFYDRYQKQTIKNEYETSKNTLYNINL